MRKSILLFLVLLISLSMGKAQNFHFFCINIGENSDGDYIVEQIGDVLNKISSEDEFMVYIRGGINNNGKMFDAYIIDNMEDWNEVSPKISKLKQYSVLPKPEYDNLLRQFQNKYEIKDQTLIAKKNIYVYWFADKLYYERYGGDILLKFYSSCMGNKTWAQCNVYPDRKGLFSNMSFGQLVNNPFIQYGNINVK